MGLNLKSVLCEFSDFALGIIPVGFQGLTVEFHSSHRFDSRKSEFITRRTPVKLRYPTVPFSTVLVLYRYKNRIVSKMYCTVPYD